MRSGCIDKREGVNDDNLKDAIEACFDDPLVMSIIWDGNFFSIDMLGENIQRGMVIRDKSFMVVDGVELYAYHDYKSQKLIINRVLSN